MDAADPRAIGDVSLSRQLGRLANTPEWREVPELARAIRWQYSHRRSFADWPPEVRASTLALWERAALGPWTPGGAR